MPYQFAKHYTLDEAQALLPRVRDWLERIAQNRRRLEDSEARLAPLLAEGTDCGGPAVTKWVCALLEIKLCLGEFAQRHIQIKDLDRGLIDFPALRGTKEIFLCWEKDEDDIEFWHDLESGYAGREPL
ncbi:MAG: DUF2203 domain-containing protein [Verrucomicrobia bacterium]|nr:DUF2203 domain-containing protein [Verrucomicrobiota bacterium]